MSTSMMRKSGAIAGIAFPIIQMAAQGLIQVGGPEPSFAAPADEIVSFFQNRNEMLFSVGEFLSVLSLVPFLWFLGALWSTIAEKNGVLSAIALGSGVVTAVALGGGGWSLAMFRISEGLEPSMARLLFDEGNLNFANSWVSSGTLVLAAGLALRKLDFPRWIGWSSLILAIAMILSRAIWTSPIAFGPHVLYWIWLIVVGVLMLRRSDAQ